jgi:hypothetical protein
MHRGKLKYEPETKKQLIWNFLSQSEQFFN